MPHIKITQAVKDFMTFNCMYPPTSQEIEKNFKKELIFTGIVCGLFILALVPYVKYLALTVLYLYTIIAISLLFYALYKKTLKLITEEMSLKSVITLQTKQEIWQSKFPFEPWHVSAVHISFALLLGHWQLAILFGICQLIEHFAQREVYIKAAYFAGRANMWVKTEEYKQWKENPTIDPLEQAYRRNANINRDSETSQD